MLFDKILLVVSWIEIIAADFTSELLLNVAEDNPYCASFFFNNLSIFIHLFY